jgi:hypothetical protein
MLTVTTAVLQVVAGPYHAIRRQNELYTHCCTYEVQQAIKYYCTMTRNLEEFLAGCEHIF